MIDTHCHLLDKRFDKDREEALQRAFAAGVTHLVEIAYKPEIADAAFPFAARHPTVFLCVGVHPHDAAQVSADYLAALRDHARHPRVVAIGETGLDFYRNRAPREDQERWFRTQIELADEMGLPVVIHQRSAVEETFAILEEMRPQAGGVLHCFGDRTQEVERARALGFKLGLGGVLTYGHQDLEAAIRSAPADMLMLETDAPYLEPEPRRLRRNEPALLPRVLAKLCELRGWAPAEADRITTSNARELFRLPIEAGAPPGESGAVAD